MKRIIAILLLLFLIFVPIFAHAAAPLSPTIASLYHFNPEIHFAILDQELTMLDLEEIEPFKILHKWEEDENISPVDWDLFYVDEEFILYLDQEYKTIEYINVLPYEREKNVYGVAIAETNRLSYVLEGFITEDGSVIFNFENIPIDNLILYIVSNQYAP